MPTAFVLNATVRWYRCPDQGHQEKQVMRRSYLDYWSFQRWCVHQHQQMIHCIYPASQIVAVMVVDS
jgi:hypothetical protein